MIDDFRLDNNLFGGFEVVKKNSNLIGGNCSETPRKTKNNNMKTLVVFIILIIFSIANAQEEPAFHKTISKFFNEFFEEGKSCGDWAKNFSPNGIFYHPANPEGARGYQALDVFCRATTAEFPRKLSQFKPSGDLPLLTKSGGSIWQLYLIHLVVLTKELNF